MTSWTAEQLQSIHRMLNPTSIAVIGATPRLQYGGRFLRAALQAGGGIGFLFTPQTEVKCLGFLARTR